MQLCILFSIDLSTKIHEMVKLSSISYGDVNVKVSSLLLHLFSNSVVRNQRITWWLILNLTLKKQVLGIEPLLGEAFDLVVDLLSFFWGLSFFVLALVCVQGLKHFCELLNLLFAIGWSLLLLFFLILLFSWLASLNSGFMGLREFLDGLVFFLITLFQFFIFGGNFLNFALNRSQMLVKLINLVL